MDVKTTITEDGKTQVTVTVPAATVKEHIDAHFKQMGKARIPGFRPGKARRPVPSWSATSAAMRLSTRRSRPT